MQRGRERPKAREEEGREGEIININMCYNDNKLKSNCFISKVRKS